MAKRALGSAGRYARARTGAALCTTARAAGAGVARARAGRPQPVWPRLAGWACLGMAGVFAIDPVGPVPTHVAASSSARPGSPLACIAALAPAGVVAAVGEFRWGARGVEPPFTLVVLDAAYRPLLRREALPGPRWAPDAAAQQVLAGRDTFHWFVVGDARGRPAGSPLAAVELGAAGTVGAIVR